MLNSENQRLLQLIMDKHPQSLKELEDLTGRSSSNLSRTLKTMAHVITSYSIHYTKLYDQKRSPGSENFPLTFIRGLFMLCIHFDFTLFFKWLVFFWGVSKTWKTDLNRFHQTHRENWILCRPPEFCFVRHSSVLFCCCCFWHPPMRLRNNFV